MGETKIQRSVLLVVGVCSRYLDAIHWSKLQLHKKWGPISLESPQYEFSETSYYTKTMGNPLTKQFFAFESLIDAADIASIKIATNELESMYADQGDFDVERPLNLDPGYLTEAKLVLATTKNRDHRIYLRDGIFAEVTLYYQNHAWQSSRWTYPDYRRDDNQLFFAQCRNWLRDRYQKQRIA